MVKAPPQIFKSPLVFVFSNEVPYTTKMKKNRLVIHDIVRLNDPAMEQDEPEVLAPVFNNLAPLPTRKCT